MSEFEEICSVIGRSNPTILDIGTNNGDNTRMFLELFPYARVFSFEPDPRAISQYRQRVQDHRAVLIEKAVGARVGVQTFHQSSGLQPGWRQEDMPLGWDQSGSIRKPTHHLVAFPWVKFEKTIEVEITTIDDWASKEKVAGIDFIWADVQGAESDLIEGARKTLYNTRYFYTEFSNNELYEGQITLDEIRYLLPEFEVIHVYGCDVLMRNKRVDNIS